MWVYQSWNTKRGVAFIVKKMLDMRVSISLKECMQPEENHRDTRGMCGLHSGAVIMPEPLFCPWHYGDIKNYCSYNNAVNFRILWLWQGFYVILPDITQWTSTKSKWSADYSRCWTSTVYVCGAAGRFGLPRRTFAAVNYGQKWVSSSLTSIRCITSALSSI